MAKQLIVITALIAALFTSAWSVSAQADSCWERIYEEQATVFFGQTIVREVKVDTVFNDDCLRIEDGRVNAHDLAAGGAIYCAPGGGVAVWDINIRSVGELTLVASPEVIAAVPTAPEVNTLIAEAGNFRLYRLTSGELQVNGPGIYSTDPEYVFTWSGCA